MQILYLLALLCFGIGVNVNAQLTSGSYNLATATTLLSYAEIAYCSDSAITAWKCGGCDPTFGNIAMFSNPAQHNFVTDNNKDTIIISFQGTSSLIAWINNLAVDLKPVSWCTGCSIHSGFLDIYNLMYNSIQSSVQQRLLRIKGAKVFATGHSLGAAIASLVAFNLVKNNVVSANAMTVYTFGMPRTGNTAFAKVYNQLMPNSWRVVNHADIVPHIPPALLTDYYSFGTLVYCSVSASTSCQLFPGSEDDGSWTHFSVDDHLSYFGTSTSSYGTSASSVGCQTAKYIPRFRSTLTRGADIILSFLEEEKPERIHMSSIESNLLI